jgi:anti-sigma regulatory factor (Ser/Thr protein kinase)
MAGMVVAEMLTVIVTTVVVKLTGKGQGMLRIPSGEEDVLDVSVGRNMAEVSAIPRDIISFCEGKLDPIRANQLAVAAEEMAANAVTYGGEGLSSIDVMLSFQDDKVLLRLRDNGIPFDPTDYSVDGDEFEFSGIELVRGLADDITYLRVLDFNNTTLEFSKGTISEAV